LSQGKLLSMSKFKLSHPLSWIFLSAVVLGGPLLQEARADLDWKAGFGGRTLPFGASANAEIGYGQLLWGEAGPGKYLYGYVKPALRYQGAGVANRGEIALDVNPISFINLKGGMRSRYRFMGDFDTLDCETSHCTGLLTSPFASASAILGYAGVFLGANFGWEKLTDADDSIRFAEEFSSLYGAPGGDTLTNIDLMAGFDITDGWSAGGIWQRYAMQTLGTSNDFKGLFGRKKWEKWSGIAGVGRYESTTKSPAGPVVFIQMDYQGTPTLDLN
jgi:hypothetical protein